MFSHEYFGWKKNKFFENQITFNFFLHHKTITDLLGSDEQMIQTLKRRLGVIRINRTTPFKFASMSKKY